MVQKVKPQFRKLFDKAEETLEKYIVKDKKTKETLNDLTKKAELSLDKYITKTISAKDPLKKIAKPAFTVKNMKPKLLKT